jgi:hypothetical protein
MNCCTEAYRQLLDVVDDLVRIAQSDLSPPEKLSLLSTQIGTAQHLMAQLPADEAASAGLAGPHFADRRMKRSCNDSKPVSSMVRSRSEARTAQDLDA